MKTNHVYMAAAGVLIIILGFVLFGKDDSDLNEEGTNTETSTSTVADVVDTNKSSGTTSSKKPAAPPPVINNNTTSGSVEPLPQSSIPVVPSETDLNGSVFRMISYNGTAIPSDSKYSISFEREKLSAKFCNSMNGIFVLDGNLIKVSNFASTMMYCTLPSNLMRIESDFASMLNFGAMIYQSGSMLILSSSQGVVMVFEEF